MWRVYVEHYLRQFVPRYKDHQALGVLGTWDGIGYASAWTAPEPYPLYNAYPIAKYKGLHRNYTLDALNERLLRRYRSWTSMRRAARTRQWRWGCTCSFTARTWATT